MEGNNGDGNGINGIPIPPHPVPFVPLLPIFPTGEIFFPNWESALPLLCMLLPMLCVLSGSFACFATALHAFARTWQSRQGTPAMLTDKTLQCSVAAHAQRGGIGIDHRPCFRAYGRIERHALCIRLLSAGSCPFSSPAVFIFTHNFVPLRQITPNGAVLGTPPLGFT